MAEHAKKAGYAIPANQKGGKDGEALWHEAPNRWVVMRRVIREDRQGISMQRLARDGSGRAELGRLSEGDGRVQGVLNTQGNTLTSFWMVEGVSCSDLLPHCCVCLATRGYGYKMCKSLEDAGQQGEKENAKAY